MKEIIDIFDYIGASPKYVGYKYMVDTSVLFEKKMSENERVIEMELYDKIARKYNTKSTCVEKNTRVCIEGTFKNGNLNHINSIFENISGYYDDRPSNKLFFMTIVNYLNKNK